jgi:hypothetical protein
LENRERFAVKMSYNLSGCGKPSRAAEPDRFYSIAHLYDEVKNFPAKA